MRVSVVGQSGSGKTTAGRALAAALECEFVELDSIQHQADWEPIGDDELRRVALERCRADGSWVVDGNYGAVRPLLWERADLVVWIDPPLWRTMAQLLWRTLRRGARREELWNGNREELRNILNRDAEENVLLWSWQSRHRNRERYFAAMASPPFDGLRFVRVCRRSELDALVASLTGDR